MLSCRDFSHVICSRLRKLLTSLQPLRHCRYQILTAVLPVALMHGLVVCFGSIFAPFKAEKFGVDLQIEILPEISINRSLEYMFIYIIIYIYTLFYDDSFVMLDCHLQRRYLVDPCSTNMNMPTKKNFREIHAASGVIYDICFQGGDSRSTLDLQTSLSCSEFATCFQSPYLQVCAVAPCVSAGGGVWELCGDAPGAFLISTAQIAWQVRRNDGIKATTLPKS